MHAQLLCFFSQHTPNVQEAHREEVQRRKEVQADLFDLQGPVQVLCRLHTGTGDEGSNAEPDCSSELCATSPLLFTKSICCSLSYRGKQAVLLCFSPSTCMLFQLFYIRANPECALFAVHHDTLAGRVMYSWERLQANPADFWSPCTRSCHSQSCQSQQQSLQLPDRIHRVRWN